MQSKNNRATFNLIKFLFALLNVAQWNQHQAASVAEEASFFTTLSVAAESA